MAEGRALWQIKPYIILLVARFLSAAALAIDMPGDGLRDALDLRLPKRLQGPAILPGADRRRRDFGRC